ncbi:TRAP transporter small permease [Rhizobium sp. L1K21]|uniref:TRAP transporter small permease n=1 Tax=Rhizobium sp. L1K21 TaxID=2954933 RepID=UPI002092E7AA|nr:TRAP transporter small permease [Rhizobium sp. L1K21]MCO6185367.1 TRAP transporter small permease [Rhizobium sp. L1K21]
MNGSFYAKAEKAMGSLALWLALLSGVFLLIAVIITSLSIAGRLAIPLGLSSIPGDYELVETFVGLAVFGFLPYCQLARGHVGVDLFIMPFGNRAMLLTQLLGDLVIAGLTLLLTWRHILGAIDKYDSGETSFILAFPIWWGFAFSAVIMVLLCIVTLFTVWRDIHDLRTNTTLEVGSGGH